VRKDLQTVKVKNWKKSVLNRDWWKTVVEQTKTQSCSVYQADGITTVLACPLSLCLFSRNLENLSLVEWPFPGDSLGGDGLLEDSFFLWKKSETAWIILLRRSRSLDFFFIPFAPSLCVKDTLPSGSK
jgi:hypothetical protein